MDEKRKMLGNFEKTFNKFLRKIAKNALFSIFFKKFNKQCVKCLRVWTKNENCWEIFDENSIENLYLYLYFILENLLLKIEPSEITPFFYNIFSVSGGIPLPPLATPLEQGPCIFRKNSMLLVR